VISNLEKELTMTRLEKVHYTAEAHSSIAANNRRSFLGASAAAGAFAFVLLATPSYAQTVLAADAQASASTRLPAKALAASEDNAIRPFHVNVPEEALVDLRRRVVATRWPAKETVTDQSQGVQLAKLQGLVKLLGNGLRLAQARGEAECFAAVCD
jgi:hypothetical protein